MPNYSGKLIDQTPIYDFVDFVGRKNCRLLGISTTCLTAASHLFRINLASAQKSPDFILRQSISHPPKIIKNVLVAISCFAFINEVHDLRLGIAEL